MTGSDDKIEKGRSIAGFFQQTRIIIWKNLLLTRRNVTGTIFEILLSILFIAILALMLSIPTINYMDDKASRPQDIISQFNPYFMDNELKGNFLYHPNTPLAQNLTMKALETLNNFYGNISINGDGCGASPTPISNCLELNGKLFLVASSFG